MQTTSTCFSNNLDAEDHDILIKQYTILDKETVIAAFISLLQLPPHTYLLSLHLFCALGLNAADQMPAGTNRSELVNGELAVHVASRKI